MKRDGRRLLRLSTLLTALVLTAMSTSLTTDPKSVSAQSPLPRVVLIGDSIRMGYAPLVAKRLSGRVEIIAATENGGDSARVRKNLDTWAIAQRPDLVHFNAGLHDLKRSRASGQYQVSLTDYEANLREIVGRLRGETSARIIFASTTPIIDARHAARGADFDRLEADVSRYNSTAISVMRQLRVPVHDLHWVVEQGGTEQLMLKDGTHYTAAGYERLAEAVADSILRQLSLKNYKPLPPQPSGPAAAADYERAQRARDALVPEAYRIRVPEFPLPASAAEWRRRRPAVLKAVRDSLGDLPPRPSPQQARRLTRELHDGFILERVSMPNGVDGEIAALLLLPEKTSIPAPAILWLHSSTPDKTQIITPGTNGGDDPLGVALVRRGYVVFSPDAYWHGDRVATGPSGSAETGVSEQASLFKFHLWLGRTLWGMFVRDDQIALDYLAARPEVDPRRIGATGMSMGSTRAWWLAAIDDRVATTVAVACLTRYENLIRHGELRQHGVYYFANGLLRHFDTEGVISLIAPRPFLALTGELDAGSPADGVRAIETTSRRLYTTLGAGGRFESILYPEVAHSYTPQMRAATLEWFDRWLQSPPTAK